MSKMTVSKTDAARRQLVTAIHLYFHFGDEIAIHTLAAASRNVLVDVCKARSLISPVFFDGMLHDFVKPEYRKELRTKVRQPENFFKHADRDVDECIDFNSNATDFFLFEAAEAHTLLSSERVPELWIFRAWWLLQNQNCVTDEYRKKINIVSYLPEERVKFFQEMSAVLR